VSDTHEYRCLACEEATVARDFDVSHLSRTCDECGEFGRFVNTIVLDQLEELEAESPEQLHWEHLERPQKFVIAERLTRHGYAIDDFDITVDADDEESADTAAEEHAADTAADESEE
jgi:hypothetical protein